MLASSMRSLFVLGLLAVALPACDGDVEPDPSSNGSVSGTGAGPGGAGGSGAAGGDGASGGSGTTGIGGAGGSGDECANVPTYLENLLAPAAACNAADPSLHCQYMIEGFCCPVVVEDANSAATLAYLDFLHLTQKQCPEMWQTCNAVDCAQPTIGNCVTDAEGHGFCEPY